MNNRSHNRRLTILESWRDGMAELGEAIAYFQHMEDTLSACIGALTSHERKVGYIVGSELSFRAIISVFVALFLHRSKQSVLSDEMRELVGRLHEAEQRRNTIVHSSWDANLQKPTAIVRRKRSCRKNGLTEIKEHVEPLVLEEDKETFEVLSKDLWYYMVELLPKYAARCPKL